MEDIFDIVLEELECSIKFDNAIYLIREVLDKACEELSEDDYEMFREIMMNIILYKIMEIILLL